MCLVCAFSALETRAGVALSAYQVAIGFGHNNGCVGKITSLIDQSGLNYDGDALSYVSGVTDFNEVVGFYEYDGYGWIGSNPVSDTNWVTFDLRAVKNISQLAYWNGSFVGDPVSLITIHWDNDNNFENGTTGSFGEFLGGDFAFTANVLDIPDVASRFFHFVWLEGGQGCDRLGHFVFESFSLDTDGDGLDDENDRYPLVSLTVNAGTANEETLPDANSNGAPDTVGANCDEACIIAAGMALDQAPTAVDVFAATLVSTASASQSATVALEGADAESDELTYTVVDGPANGSLSDPNNADATVITGAITSQTLTYTPDSDFTGTDTFTYRVNDGVSDSATTYTATITVFDAVRAQAKQIGADIDGESAGDQSGTSVALSSDGQTLAVGAPLNDGNGGNAGHVRVYDLNGSTWDQRGADIDGEAANDNSGYSVALSSDGQTLAVGAPYNNGTGAAAGHVRVFEWDGSTWSQLGGDIDGEAAGDQSGVSVALSSDGQILAVGAYFNDSVNVGTKFDGDPNPLAGYVENGPDSYGLNAGHVRVYAWSGSAWSQLGDDIDGEAAYDESGTSVALSSDGQTLAVGASENYNTEYGGVYFTDGAPRAGHVRVYTWNGSAWTQLGADIDAEAQYDQSGRSVALSSDGQTLAVGAWLNDDNGSKSVAGHVRVYAWDGSAWSQLGADIDGEAAGDVSGTSVALSSDGQTLAVGAPGIDEIGSARGHVRVYAWNGSAWSQLGADIDGEAVGDSSGWPVVLSSDGQTLAVGARLNDGNGSDAGHVRVYDLKTFSPEIGGTANRAAVSGVAYEAFDDPGTALDPTERLTASDTDLVDSNLTFSATAGGGALPGWLAVDAVTGALSGTPTADDVGAVTSIVLSVSDGTLSDDLPAFDLTVLLDTDEDGQPDDCDANCVASGFTADADDDNDLVDDVQDDFPTDPDETADTDSDGLGDNADQCDSTATAESDDINASGCGPSERDTDGDGTNDNLDAFPNNPNETLDSDGDGYGDNEETEAGTDPNDADDQPIQSGLPIWLLYEASKS